MREVVPERVAEARDESVYERLERRVNPHPFAPDDPRRLDERCEEVFQILATSLAQRLQSLPPGLRKVVIGISGGRDSTLALLVAVRAFDHLGLSRKDITGVTMPGFGTSEKTKSIARSLVTSLGGTLREVEITGISTSVFEAIGHDPDDEDTTFENVQAWTRKFIEFSVASDISGIDLGTSDLSELALGWTTYGGDHMSHYGVNAGVPKTLVSQVIRWSADTVFASEPEVADTLAAVLGLPISPELRRLSSEGTIVQLSEEMVGPYELADFFLYYFTRFGYRPQRIARMALQAFEGRYTLAEIKSWLTTFIQRFFACQF
jgi:NAD+ synthase (glutamine-hydrolysing)